MNDPQYDLESLRLPRMAGGLLRLFVALIESPLTRWLLLPSLLRSGGITRLRDLTPDAPPTFQPYVPPCHVPPQPQASLQAVPPPDTHPQGPFATLEDYARAYRSSAATPEDVAHAVLGAIADSDRRSPPLRAFVACDEADVLEQARASTRRFREGQPLGPWDGVPVAVKDEVDQQPYATTVGTRFLGRVPAKEDATVVARLRAAGALLIGKTNMHEIGIGVTGLNPHHGTARNPYHTGHYTGGSSSGSAAAVAAGLCPVAVGADGGGSIRIPAAFCGVVGLKPTHGRVSEFGAAPLCWSLAHLGPLGATARDVAQLYALLAGPDPRDPYSLRQPPVTLEGFERLDLSDLTLGIYPPWFEHATPAVVDACRQVLRGLESMGARVREIAIPGLEAARVAHVVTITSEMMAAMDCHYATHRRDFGPDVRINLALARSFTARDYVRAQRVRTETIANFCRALEQVDAILTPATGLTAPAIPPDALPDGESDLTTLTQIMRFATPANLTGLPAVAFPAGYDAQGLPAGCQAIGRAWEEHVLLRLAHAAGQVVERRAPRVHYRLLPA